MKARVRIDQLLTDRGLAESRSKAQALVLAGQVLADEKKIEKPGQQVNPECEIRILGEQPRYVSRAGFKLEGALSKFGIDVQGKTCLDIGASTGGFTDCLLQHGAAKVYAVDVGTNQLHWRIRQVGKGGIVRNDEIRQAAADKVRQAIDALGFRSIQQMDSPLEGAQGNREILLYGRDRQLTS